MTIETLDQLDSKIADIQVKINAIGVEQDRLIGEKKELQNKREVIRQLMNGESLNLDFLNKKYKKTNHPKKYITPEKKAIVVDQLKAGVDPEKISQQHGLSLAQVHGIKTAINRGQM